MSSHISTPVPPRDGQPAGTISLLTYINSGSGSDTPILSPTAQSDSNCLSTSLSVPVMAGAPPLPTNVVKPLRHVAIAAQERAPMTRVSSKDIHDFYYMDTRTPAWQQERPRFLVRRDAEFRSKFKARKLQAQQVPDVKLRQLQSSLDTISSLLGKQRFEQTAESASKLLKSFAKYAEQQREDVADALAQVYNYLGHGLLGQGEHAEAMKSFETAIKLAEGAKKKDNTASLEARLGMYRVYARIGQFSKAIETIESAFGNKKHKTASECLWSMVQTGWCHMEEGNLEEAQRCGETAFQKFRGVDDKQMELELIMLLAKTSEIKHEARVARSYYQRALDIAIDLNNLVVQRDIRKKINDIKELGTLPESEGTGDKQKVKLSPGTDSPAANKKVVLPPITISAGLSATTAQGKIPTKPKIARPKPSTSSTSSSSKTPSASSVSSPTKSASTSSTSSPNKSASTSSVPSPTKPKVGPHPPSPQKSRPPAPVHNCSTTAQSPKKQKTAKDVVKEKQPKPKRHNMSSSSSVIETKKADSKVLVLGPSKKEIEQQQSQSQLEKEHGKSVDGDTKSEKDATKNNDEEEEVFADDEDDINNLIVTVMTDGKVKKFSRHISEVYKSVLQPESEGGHTDYLTAESPKPGRSFLQFPLFSSTEPEGEESGDEAGSRRGSKCGELFSAIAKALPPINDCEEASSEPVDNTGKDEAQADKLEDNECQNDRGCSKETTEKTTPEINTTNCDVSVKTGADNENDDQHRTTQNGDKVECGEEEKKEQTDAQNKESDDKATSKKEDIGENEAQEIRAQIDKIVRNSIGEVENSAEGDGEVNNNHVKPVTSTPKITKSVSISEVEEVCNVEARIESESLSADKCESESEDENEDFDAPKRTTRIKSFSEVGKGMHSIAEVSSESDEDPAIESVIAMGQARGQMQRTMTKQDSLEVREYMKQRDMLHSPSMANLGELYEKDDGSVDKEETTLTVKVETPEEGDEKIEDSTETTATEKKPTENTVDIDNLPMVNVQQASQLDLRANSCTPSDQAAADDSTTNVEITPQQVISEPAMVRNESAVTLDGESVTTEVTELTVATPSEDIVVDLFHKESKSADSLAYRPSRLVITDENVSVEDLETHLNILLID